MWGEGECSGRGGRQSIILLEGSQASPARPSGNSIMKWKLMNQKKERKKSKLQNCDSSCVKRF
jgi:hypothetical protein